MRIIYLHQYFLTPAMAGGHRSYEMARRLVRAGHEVHMITSAQGGIEGGRRWRESVEDGINVHWANVPYSNHMGFTRRIAAFIQFSLAATRRAMRLRGDVIFATSTPLTIAIPALVASGIKRIPFVFEVRDMWPDVPIAIGAIRNPVVVWLARRLELLTYRRAAQIVALAPGMRDDIVAKGIAPGRVSVIPNGCDVDLFSQSPSHSGVPRPDVRAQHSWLGHRKLVLYAGTIGLVNGVDYLVRLARDVRAVDPDIRFVVIGAGRERDAVRMLATAEGVLDENFFMLQPIPSAELAKWLGAADIAVALFTGPRAVWKDAVQNKFFDAVAAGKPIANNFDGWQAQVAAEANIGVALDPSRTDVAARQLTRALHDEEWLAGVPARAGQLAHTRFHRDLLSGQLEAVLLRASHGAGEVHLPRG